MRAPSRRAGRRSGGRSALTRPRGASRNTAHVGQACRLGLDGRVSDARVRPPSPRRCSPSCSAWSGARRSSSSSWPSAISGRGLRRTAGTGRGSGPAGRAPDPGRRRAPRSPPHPRVHVVGLVLAAASVADFLVFSTLGLELSGIGFGVVLIYAQPLLVAGMARLALGERLSLVRSWGCSSAGPVSRSPSSGSCRARTPDRTCGRPPCSSWARPCASPSARWWSRPSPPGPRAFPAARAPAGLRLRIGAAGRSRDDRRRPVHWTGSLVVSILYAGVVSLAGGYLLQFALLERGTPEW